MISYKLLKRGGGGGGGGYPGGGGRGLYKKASVFVQSFINIRHRHPRPIPVQCLFTVQYGRFFKTKVHFLENERWGSF